MAQYQPRQFDLKELSPKRILIGAALLVVVIGLFSSFYTVDANESAVVLRLGQLSHTTSPGLHFKFPFGIDEVYKVETEKIFKLEFGFRTTSPGVRTQYTTSGYEDESWMLTGDLNMAEVMWAVQYKIKDPEDYLFQVRDVESTIRDVSEATVRLMIGDRSFQEVLQAERITIANLSKEHMQMLLDKYHSGIDIQHVLLQDVFPPKPVADSFNEVNRAKQEQEEAINEARQQYNKEIYRVEGEAKRMLAEAEGYAIERINTAKGDSALFGSVYQEYKKAPQITRDRLYLETMNKIYSRSKNKVVVDKRMKNLLPLLNLNQGGTK